MHCSAVLDLVGVSERKWTTTRKVFPQLNWFGSVHYHHHHCHSSFSGSTSVSLPGPAMTVSVTIMPVRSVQVVCTVHYMLLRCLGTWISGACKSFHRRIYHENGRLLRRQRPWSATPTPTHSILEARTSFCRTTLIKDSTRKRNSIDGDGDHEHLEHRCIRCALQRARQYCSKLAAVAWVLRTSKFPLKTTTNNLPALIARPSVASLQRNPIPPHNARSADSSRLLVHHCHP